MTNIVFAGPTLPPAQVAALLPGARVLPPVRHGDLLGLDLAAGDRVLIIDGVFLQTASVRHREILHLLRRGVIVAGSSSMGALRAAELHRFGMRGFGEIFRLYRDGAVEGDDEVAIVHGTAEDGYRAYSDPLVSIRIALRDAAAAGVIGGDDAAAMLGLARDMPFRARSFRALDRAAHGRIAGAGAFAAWRGGRDTDAKAADARLMLAAAAADNPVLSPAGPGDELAQNVRTRLFIEWQHRFTGLRAGDELVSDGQAIGAIRLAYPGFRDAYRRHVLGEITGAQPDDPALVAKAAAVARARGLRADPPALAGGWLTGPETALDGNEALATLLARMIGVRMPGLPAALITPAVLAWGRQFAAAAHSLNARLLAPGGGPRRRFRPAAVDLAVAGLWGCDAGSLETQSWDRGIGSLTELRLLAEPFVAHLKVLGASPVRRLNVPAAARRASALPECDRRQGRAAGPAWQPQPHITHGQDNPCGLEFG